MFEDYLKEVHGELFPMLLDDDMSDHFDDWLGSLDGEDYIRYANLYGVQVALITEKKLINLS